MALVIMDPYDQPTRARDGLVIYRNGPVQTAMRSRSRPCVTPHLTRNPALNIITVLSERWELLSNAQRIGWGNYAYASPLLDAWGNDRFIRGYAHYMRSNRPRLVFAEDPIDDPPTTNGFPDFTLPTLAITTDTLYVAARWNTADDWANDHDGIMYLWISPPTSTAREYPPETYRPFFEIDRFSGFHLGHTTIPNPYSGRPSPTRIFIRASVQMADGRLSDSRPT